MEHDLILNVYDPTLNYCDIYMLDYYGIMVFFEPDFPGAPREAH